MKKKIKKEYLKKARKLLETKLYSSYIVKGVNTLAVHLVRYSGRFLKRTREELRQMDQRTWKVTNMHKALDPRADVYRLYESRRERGRGLASIEDSMDTSIQRLEAYIEKRGGGFITATRNNINNMRTSRKTITWKKIGRKTTLWMF